MYTSIGVAKPVIEIRAERRLAVCSIGLSLLLVGVLSSATSAAVSPDKGALAFIRVAELPTQAQDTLRLIRKGGSFPFAHKDGSVFGNVERILPKQPRGYYKEYTVLTPGIKSRGARRIVCGGSVTGAVNSICYYTSDHYASFKRVQE